jgi:predicted metalloprotease
VSSGLRNPQASSRRAGWIAAAVAFVVAAGCTLGPNRSDSPARPGTQAGRSASVPADTVVNNALRDVERYWAATYPKLAGGARFTPLRGGYHPYTRSQPPPPCGAERPQYQPNAFYCPDGDFIAWDAEVLIPQLNDNFGSLLVAVVMAHEYSHAVQQRLNLTGQPTIVLEQQADCFAGSWVGDVKAGHSPSFRTVQPDQLDNTVGGLLMLRDQPGNSAVAPQAHGNAFDRIRAFQEGFEQSAPRCASYRADNLPVTEVPFTSRQDAANGGDLPYDQAVTSLGQDVEAYWSRTFPSLAGRAWDPLRVVPFDPADPPQCPDRQQSSSAVAGAAFSCPAGGFVAFDNQRLGPTLYRDIGDNAIGMLVADLFAQAVQQRRDRPTEGRTGQLAVDCLAGSWTYDLLHRTGGNTIRLSPGDLDEAVAALLVLGRADKASADKASADKAGEASAFDRIVAFRNGVLDGLSACG